MIRLRLTVLAALTGAATTVVVGGWFALGGLALGAILLLLLNAGLRGVVRAMFLGIWLVIFAGGSRLLMAALNAPLTWEATQPALLLSLRLLILFLFAGVLAGTGPRGLASLVPGRLGRWLRSKLEVVFAGFLLALERGRLLRADGYRVHQRRGRLTAYLRTFLRGTERQALRQAELSATSGRKTP